MTGRARASVTDQTQIKKSAKAPGGFMSPVCSSLTVSPSCFHLLRAYVTDWQPVALAA